MGCPSGVPRKVRVTNRDRRRGHMPVSSSTTSTWQQPTWTDLLQRMFGGCSEQVRLVVPSMDARAQDLLRRAVALAWALGYLEVSNVHVVLAALGLRRERELSLGEPPRLNTWRTSSMLDTLLVGLGAHKELQLGRRMEIGDPFPPLAPAVEKVLTEALFRAEWGAMTWIGAADEHVLVTDADVLAEVIYAAPSDALFRSVLKNTGKSYEDLSFLLIS